MDQTEDSITPAHLSGEGHQYDSSGLALPIDARPSSTVAFSLLYIGLCRILGLALSGRQSESDKDIEIVVLRHQVHVLERRLHARVRYRPTDRAMLAALSRLLSRARRRSFLVTPDTLLRWHREAAKHKWRRWGKQCGPSRPPMSDELVGLIVRLVRDNRRWGCIRTNESSESLGSGSRPVRSDGSPPLIHPPGSVVECAEPTHEDHPHQ